VKIQSRRKSRRFLVKHRTICCILAAIFAVAVRLSFLPYLPIPDPKIHDEYSYLLGGDTFASGRLSNPVHPMWVHFETFHVNQQPTYATKYQPGQSLFLALGQKAFGHPWYGVLLSVGLMCACICWMLQGWLPLGYALFGTLLAIFQFGVASYWINSYWGGALPAAAGALVLGAIPRLMRRSDMSSSLLGSLGIALLANTRPYEGCVVTCVSCVVLLWGRQKNDKRWSDLLRARVIVPAALVLCSTAIWMGYYNYRVTGKPWVMPYLVNDMTYAAAPHFWLSSPPARPNYRHEVLRKFWTEWDWNHYLNARANPFLIVANFVYIVYSSYRFPLLLSAITSVLLAPTRKVRVALGIAGSLALALFLVTGLAPHYYAAVTGLILFLACTGVRSILRRLPKRSAVRRLTAVALAGSFFFSFTVQTIKSIRSDAEPPSNPSHRRSIVDRLMRKGSRHVVIVRYAPEHNVHEEWVYNRADIDGSSIVWARDMGETDNADLIRYYQDRKIWLFEPDLVPVRLTAYPFTPIEWSPNDRDASKREN
jgi:hypothetical protein